MSKQISHFKAMTWLPKLTFIIYNVRKDNQQRKHTHTQSLKPRSSPDTLYQNPNPLPHAHICRFWLVLLLDCVDRQPSRASACPPHLSVSASHSFAHLCPVKHHRSSYLGGDWRWQAVNTICSSSIRQSSSSTLSWEGLDMQDQLISWDGAWVALYF